jgi:uncharacterized protein YecT (DUF1311 family)
MVRPAAMIYALVLAVGWPACAQTDRDVAARLTPEVRACEQAPENSGTLQQALCYKDEDTRQDKRLNDLWAQVMSSISPARRQNLRANERRWVEQRDEDCKDEANAYINSTAAYMYNRCYAEESIRRIIWMERFARRRP